jgi:hypothetical protein
MQGNIGGTGVITVSSPNTNSDRSIVLPDASGTVQLEGAAVNIGGNNISAVNSLGFRNRIINGDMRIDQRNAGASVTPVSRAYTLDRWTAEMTTGSRYSVQQNAGAVTPPTGFSNYLGVTSAAATSLGATSFFAVAQIIEGFNIADLAWGTANAQAITISFWVRSSLTGTFGGALNNSGSSRSYPFTYAISAANTWEQKTLTIAGDTSGTWLANNGIGLYLVFGLGCGTTRSGTAGAWNNNWNFSATGAVSVVGTDGATWQVTGVQLEAGSVATPFERRDYGREMMMCQRYYYKTLGVSNGSRLGVGYATATTTAEAILFFPSSMRVAPSSLEQSGTISDYGLRIPGVTIVCSSVPVFVSSNDTSANVLFPVSSGLTSGQAIFGRSGSTNGFLAWSAEL